MAINKDIFNYKSKCCASFSVLVWILKYKNWLLYICIMVTIGKVPNFEMKYLSQSVMSFSKNKRLMLMKK